MEKLIRKLIHEISNDQIINTIGLDKVNKCIQNLIMCVREQLYLKWDKVFKNGPSKICDRQPLRNLK